jgi:hypothetical protein
VHEHVAVLPLGLEAVLVEQADDLVGGMPAVSRVKGGRSTRKRPQASPARSAAAAPASVPESEPARMAASRR